MWFVVAAAALTAPPGREVAFSKYQGLGNDFLLVDNRDSEKLKVGPEEAAQLCNRNFGVGGDGVIFVLPAANGGDYAMRIINSDASEPEMCGNGIRCVARFLDDLGDAGRASDRGRAYNIETLGGVMVPVLREDGTVTVDMGEPELSGVKVPTTLKPTVDDRVIEADVLGDYAGTCVSMGNPHCVVFVDDVAAIDLETLGKEFEHHPVFPNRVNTEFVEVIDPRVLKMRVWERGAGATLACGTGACAVGVAAVLTGRADRAVKVQLPGGDLHIDWRADDNRVYMTGDAKFVFKGHAAL
ncbi:hypothetical protein CTAYLR_007304 [Chrysophaeum taylorii]|uniref:Diaminopimelate epimerase n=1 Tax=Chrysophaeum taylorii TaxID=2483200 RepID=A0AAD7UI42_9STRA|nr:hypothetical protein CTAYLR_007304 [Chrysophaeum taylorii]